jgi:hypothetical protein
MTDTTTSTVAVAVTKAPRFTFTSKAWLVSIASGVGVALKPANHPKLLAHALSIKAGAPSDLKKVTQATLVKKVAAKLAALDAAAAEVSAAEVPAVEA